MLTGQIFREITWKDYREFDWDLVAICECAQSDFAERMRRIIRWKDYNNPVRFFSKDWNNWWFRDKLWIETRTINEIFQEKLDNL